MNQKRIGLIGAGKMATALAAGWIRSGLAQPETMLASDPYEAARKSFTEQTEIPTTDSNREVLESSEVVLLAVKPQVLSGLLEELADSSTSEHLFVSIIAGARLERFEATLPKSRHIRVMPNTPCLVGEGASGYAAGSTATKEDLKLVEELLSTVGIALPVAEHLLDAVTGLSGSGPAYVFEIIEALSDGGVLAGLPRATATQLAAQTLLGAAKMVLESGQHPGQLKDAVTSPGGTTISGLHQLEQGCLRGTLMNAVEAATKRSQELGKT
ncbi:pyrroline-5-carboxylate reductase [Thalassoglobus sp. JC818]|uniref:pyrroline-5-carboxylate reductase n=1 Tax=Thalassoglobus sp. JC818 TaxID=3232136 RepID=UPI00345A0247